MRSKWKPSNSHRVNEGNSPHKCFCYVCSTSSSISSVSPLRFTTFTPLIFCFRKDCILKFWLREHLLVIFHERRVTDFKHNFSEIFLNAKHFNLYLLKRLLLALVARYFHINIRKLLDQDCFGLLRQPFSKRLARPTR